MDCKVKWVGPDGMSFVAETGSGHAFVMDGAPDGGGRNLGPRPMETVLAGTGGCTAYDVVLIDRKSTRLNSSHANISYAVFCLKKKKKQEKNKKRYMKNISEIQSSKKHCQ